VSNPVLSTDADIPIFWAMLMIEAFAEPLGVTAGSVWFAVFLTSATLRG